MRHQLIILLFAGITFATTIGDFAPTQVGSVWEYTYNNYKGNVYQVTLDSLTLHIELLSKSAAKNDTIVVLRIREEGRSIMKLAADSFRAVSDTVGSVQFLDTAIISGDSIRKSISFRSKVFPFWKSHQIGNDSLRQDISGTDSLHCIALYLTAPYTYQIDTGTPLVKWPYSYIYCQNAGFYSSVEREAGMNSLSTTIQLTRFNGKPIPVSVQPVAGASRKFNRATAPGYAKVLSVWQRTDVPHEAFSLAGRRIPASAGRIPGLMLRGVKASPKNPK